MVEPSAPPLFEAEAESGCCRVVCFSEQHHLRLARMDDAGVARALRTLFDEFAVLERRGRVSPFPKPLSIRGPGASPRGWKRRVSLPVDSGLLATYPFQRLCRPVA